MYDIGFPFMNTERSEISFIRDLGMSTLAYPVVPDGPRNTKTQFFASESKDNPERVEFESTEKMLCSVRVSWQS